MKRAEVIAVAVGLALGFAGCVAVQRVNSAIDCSGICHRYASCFSTAYDVSGCADRCRDHAATDDTFRVKAEKCNTCITDRACASAVFACVSECVSVVP